MLLEYPLQKHGDDIYNTILFFHTGYNALCEI